MNFSIKNNSLKMSGRAILSQFSPIDKILAVIRNLLSRYPITFSFFAALLISTIYLARYQFQPEVFVAAARHHVECYPDAYKSIKHFEWGGSDGSMNYVASQDPLFLKSAQIPDCMRSELSYTRQRFLFHFFSWLASLGGNPRILPIAMIGLNLLCVFLVAFFAKRILVSKGIHPIWVVPLTLAPGIWQTLRFSLVDLLWYALFMIFWNYKEKRGYVGMAISSLLLMLTRSASLAMIGLVCAELLWTRKDVVKTLVTFSLPLVGYYIFFKPWILKVAGSADKVFFGESLIGLPFGRFISQMQEFISSGQYASVLSGVLLSIFLFIVLVYLIIEGLSELRKFRIHTELTFPAMVIGSFFFFNNIAWGNSVIQLTRVSLIPFALILFYLLQYRQRLAKPFVSVLMVLSALSVLWFIFSQKVPLVAI